MPHFYKKKSGKYLRVKPPQVPTSEEYKFLLLENSRLRELVKTQDTLINELKGKISKLESRIGWMEYPDMMGK